MKMNWKIAFGLVVSASLIGAFCTGGVIGNEEMAESSIIGLIIGALVGVVISVALLPTIGSQVTLLENDSTNFSSTETTLIGLWPLFIIIGVSMYFVNMFI